MRTVEPLTPLCVAVIVLVPGVSPCASPPALIVATPVLADPQAAVAVRSMVERSELVPVAVNCWFAPTAIDGFGGVTAMLQSPTGPSLSQIVVTPVASVIAPFTGVLRLKLNFSPGSTSAQSLIWTRTDLRRFADGEVERAVGRAVVGVAGVAGTRRDVQVRVCDLDRVQARLGEADDEIDEARGLRHGDVSRRGDAGLRGGGSFTGADRHGTCAVRDRCQQRVAEREREALRRLGSGVVSDRDDHGLRRLARRERRVSRRRR